MYLVHTKYHCACLNRSPACQTHLIKIVGEGEDKSGRGGEDEASEIGSERNVGGQWRRREREKKEADGLQSAWHFYTITQFSCSHNSFSPTTMQLTGRLAVWVEGCMLELLTHRLACTLVEWLRTWPVSVPQQNEWWSNMLFELDLQASSKRSCTVIQSKKVHS